MQSIQSEIFGRVFNIKFDVRYANHPEDSKHYDTATLRRHYHISNLFEKDSINLTYSHQDRIIAGGSMPVDKGLVLESCKELAAPYFLARRELGAINIGGDGIGPGYIETPQTAPLREKRSDGSDHPFHTFLMGRTPAGRWGQPEGLAGPAVFLSSEASDFVNGQILYVDGGILAYIGKQP